MKNFQMSKLGLEKEEELEIKLPTFAIIEKAEEFQKNNDLYFIDYAKAFDCVDHYKLWKALKEMGNTRQSYLSPKKPVCGSRSNS